MQRMHVSCTLACLRAPVWLCLQWGGRQCCHSPVMISLQMMGAWTAVHWVAKTGHQACKGCCTSHHLAASANSPRLTVLVSRRCQLDITARSSWMRWCSDPMPILCRTRMKPCCTWCLMLRCPLMLLHVVWFIECWSGRMGCAGTVPAHCRHICHADLHPRSAVLHRSNTSVLLSLLGGHLHLSRRPT